MPPSHGGSHWFDPSTAHHLLPAPTISIVSSVIRKKRCSGYSELLSWKYRSQALSAHIAFGAPAHCDRVISSHKALYRYMLQDIDVKRAANQAKECEHMTLHKGGCHCGAVRFEVEAPENVVVQECNCSICSKSGFLHLIVKASNFRLLSGEEYLTAYTFDTHEAKHLFCKICGIKSFYIPRSNPDGFNVNTRCLDEGTIRTTIEPFDGRNWEANAHRLAHLSKD